MLHLKPLTVTTILGLLICAGSAQAGLFGKTSSSSTGSGSLSAASAQNAAASGSRTNDLPGTPPVTYFKKASHADIEAALRMEPLAQAAFFNNQYEHDPSDTRMGLYLSQALRTLGRNAEAADIAHRVLLIAPENYDVLLAAARAHIADNNAFYAVDALQQALRLRPDDWQAHSLLGVAYEQIKRTDDAQSQWAIALKLSPNNPTVLTNMAVSKVATGDFATAEPLLRTAAAQKDANLQVRQNLALVLGLEGKLQEAEVLLRRDLPPEQADANLAWLQQKLQARPTPPASDRSWDSVRASGS